MGAAGERFAAWWLSGKGFVILARNLEVDGGEIDILARDSIGTVAVEVRSVTAAGDPIDAVDPVKRSHVRALAGRVSASRVGYLGVGFRSWGVEVHWVPG